MTRQELSFRRIVFTVAILMGLFGLAAKASIWSDQRRYDFQHEAFRHQHWLLSRGADAFPGKHAQISYHINMSNKYQWAANYPLLPLWPDPLEPK